MHGAHRGRPNTAGGTDPSAAANAPWQRSPSILNNSHKRQHAKPGFNRLSEPPAFTVVKKVLMRGLRLKASLDVGPLRDTLRPSSGAIEYRGRVLNRAARIGEGGSAWAERAVRAGCV